MPCAAMKKGLTLSLLFLLVLSACKQDANQPENAAASALLEQTISWHCRLMALSHQSKVLWDSVAMSMDRQLPADMPADERRNMLAVRNTDLIQMFQVYPQLDSSIRQLVEMAGVKDVEIAQMMHAAQDSLERCDSLSQLLLMGLDKTNPAELAYWKPKFANAQCPEGSTSNQ